MKRKIIIEMEWPDEFDACWTDDGAQTFYDTLFLGAMSYLLEAWMEANVKAKKEPTETNIAYAMFLKRKYDVATASKYKGYIDEDGKVHNWNDKTYEFEDG